MRAYFQEQSIKIGVRTAESGAGGRPGLTVYTIFVQMFNQIIN